MTAIFTRPFNAVTFANSTSVHNTVGGNALNDEPAMVWRSSGTEVWITYDLGSARTFDTVAVANTNLTEQSRVRFTAGNDGAANAFTAVDYSTVHVGRFEGTPTKIMKLAEPVTYRYVKILVDNSTAALSYVEIGRAIIGMSITVEGGVDASADFSVESFTEDTRVPGGIVFDHQRSVPALKFSVSMVTEQEFRDEWHPMVFALGKGKGLLFAWQLEEGHQHEIIFGHLTGGFKSKHRVYDNMTLDIEIEAFKY